MSTDDDLTTRCLQLLRRAGLARAEDILRLPRQALADRLADAGRELGISPGVSPEELIKEVEAAAGRRGAGELTYADLRDLWRDLPSSAVRGLPGQDDFPVWGRDRDVDEVGAGLPGEDDFRPWGGDRDEEESER